MLWNLSRLRSTHQVAQAGGIGVEDKGELPRGWTMRVNRPQHGAEVEAARSIRRGTRYGGERWMTLVATRPGLQFTLRLRSRPRTK